MPIDIETFESSPEDRLQHSGETNADRVMRFLATHPEQAFTQSEIRDATDVKAGSISVVLSRLEDRGLVRHKGNYWALGEVDDVAAYASMLESTRAANDRFGAEDMDEWLEHAVDDIGQRFKKRYFDERLGWHETTAAVKRFVRS